MRLKFKPFILILLLASSLMITAGIVMDSTLTDTPDISNVDVIDDFNSRIDSVSQKLQGNLRQYMETGIEPEGFNQKLMVYADSDSIGINTTLPAVNLGNKYLHIVDQATPDLVRQLYLNNKVKTILPDQIIDYSQDAPTRVSEAVSQDASISPDSFQAEDILNLDRVHNEFGYTGDNVTIGIIDSGIDFGSSDLSNSAVLDDSGYLDSLDVTGSGLAITSLTITPYTSQGVKYLPLEGTVIDIFLGDQFALQTTQQLGIQLEDLKIGNIADQSISGQFKVGIAQQGALTEGLPTQYFLFILVDSQTEGVYDQLYVDMETSLAISLVQSGIILSASQTFIRLSEYDLTNDDAFGSGNPIPAKDITGDGINDVSMGGLATVIDFTGLSGDTLVKGIDPEGRAIGMMFDGVGHGTLTASAAASDGNTSFPVYDDIDTPEVENGTLYNLKGSAPNAKIITSKAFSISEFILGWFWTGGMRLKYEGGELVWEGHSDKTVDVSSNSWGNGEVASSGYLKGFDPNSLLLDYLSQNGTLFDDYPGTIFVVSGGNGAPGWGTTASPAMASMALTIGASTYYHYRNGSTGRNDVAWFSARGPSSYGTVKPDLITPGYAGFVNVQVIRGLGNGTYASDFFGGTSEAAPRATGVIALLIEAARDMNQTYDFESLRLVLKSTATDLGFEVQQQGAGLIDAYSAVNAIVDNEILVSSTYSSDIAAQNLQNAYFKEFDQDHPLKNNSLQDFVTVITPEQLRNGIDLNLVYSNGTPVPSSEYTSKAFRSDLAYTDSEAFTTTSIQNTHSLAGIMPDDLTPYEFFELSITFDENTANRLLDNGLQTPDILLKDDSSGDIVADTFSFSTWAQLMYSGFPALDFQGTPYLSLTDPGYREAISNWPGMKYSLSLRLFDETSWSAINIVNSDGNVTLDYSGTVDELQTFYVEITTSDSSISVPIMISPNHQAEFADNVEKIGADLDVTQPYNQFEVANTFDWGYRPESGDFNHYRISVPEAATYLAAFAQWQASGLEPNMYLFNSTGNLIAQSDTEYIGGGLYETKTSEPFSQNLLVEAKDTQYYLMIHTTRLPFTPGPHNLDVFFRYLDLAKLPTPVPTYSKSINSPISGTLGVDVSSYQIDQFPEFRINRVSAQMYQGSNATIDRTISSGDLIEGINSQFRVQDFDDAVTLDLLQGEKVDLSISWDGEIDADMYVYKQGDQINQQNDLLKGTGTNPRNSPEVAKFAADRQGQYIVYIDYVSGLDDGEDFSYQLEYNSRKGPTIQSNLDSISIDTSLFPDDAYGILFTFSTNFNYDFNLRINITTENSEEFTFGLNSPSENDEISGDVDVSWSSSVDVVADISLVIDNTSIRLGASITGTTFNFNSRLYPNGDAVLVVMVSNGIMVQSINVSVTIDNADVSTLPEITSSQNQSLPIPIVFLLGLIILPLVKIYFRSRDSI